MSSFKRKQMLEEIQKAVHNKQYVTFKAKEIVIDLTGKKLEVSDDKDNEVFLKVVDDDNIVFFNFSLIEAFTIKKP